MTAAYGPCEVCGGAGYSLLGAPAIRCYRHWNEVIDTLCRFLGRYERSHADAKRRPTFGPPVDEAGWQYLCDPCWEDYQDMIFRSWQSHVG